MDILPISSLWTTLFFALNPGWMRLTRSPSSIFNTYIPIVVVVQILVECRSRRCISLPSSSTDSLCARKRSSIFTLCRRNSVFSINVLYILASESCVIVQTRMPTLLTPFVSPSTNGVNSITLSLLGIAAANTLQMWTSCLQWNVYVPKFDPHLLGVSRWVLGLQ